MVFVNFIVSRNFWKPIFIRFTMLLFVTLSWINSLSKPSSDVPISTTNYNFVLTKSLRCRDRPQCHHVLLSFVITHPQNLHHWNPLEGSPTSLVITLSRTEPSSPKAIGRPSNLFLFSPGSPSLFKQTTSSSHLARSQSSSLAIFVFTIWIE